MSTLHVFDLDGTLYDTKLANKRAYERAGLPEYKDEYHAMTAKAWGCPPEIHEKKSQLFHEYAHLIKPDWAMPMFEIANGCNRAIVLTGASAESVRVMESIHGSRFPTPFGITHDEDSKKRVLATLLRCNWEVVYYDDNVAMGTRLVKGLSNSVNNRIKLITPPGENE